MAKGGTVMLTNTAPPAHETTLSTYPLAAVALLCSTLLLLSFPRTAHCTLDTLGTGKCSLALQLQKSPFREQYRAKVAAKADHLIYDEASAASAEETPEPPDYWDFSGKAARASDFQTGTIDSFSSDCLSCHDGRIATEVTLTVRDSPSYARERRHFSGKDHPIGMDYAQYLAFNRRYKAAAVSNSNLIFINGRVGCLTCHNPLNPEKNHLVMSDRRSALCLTCHNK
jgi:predicted CXXCH cytochrome family protein